MIKNRVISKTENIRSNQSACGAQGTWILFLSDTAAFLALIFPTKCVYSIFKMQQKGCNFQSEMQII